MLSVLTCIYDFSQFMYCLQLPCFYLFSQFMYLISPTAFKKGIWNKKKLQNFIYWSSSSSSKLFTFISPALEIRLLSRHLFLTTSLFPSSRVWKQVFVSSTSSNIYDNYLSTSSFHSKVNISINISIFVLFISLRWPKYIYDQIYPEWERNFIATAWYWQNNGNYFQCMKRGWKFWVKNHMLMLASNPKLLSSLDALEVWIATTIHQSLCYTFVLNYLPFSSV